MRKKYQKNYYSIISLCNILMTIFDQINLSISFLDCGKVFVASMNLDFTICYTRIRVTYFSWR